MLDGLELADGPAELLADLRVCRRSVGGPSRDADGLRGQQRGHQCARQGPAQVAEHAIIADLDGVGAHVCQRPQRVDALDRLDLQRLGVEHHPLFATVDGDRQHQDRRLRRGGNRPHLAADDQASRIAFAVPRGGQSRVDRIGGDHLAGGQVVQQLGVGVVGGDKRACDRRRNERARHRAVAELGQDDSQFEDAEALSTNGFRQVHALQALIGRGLPEWWRVRDRSFEGFVQHLRWRHPRHQGPYRIGQVVVLRSDRDRHSYLLGLPY